VWLVCVVGLCCFVLFCPFFFFRLLSSFFVYVERPWSLIFNFYHFYFRLDMRKTKDDDEFLRGDRGSEGGASYEWRFGNEKDSSLKDSLEPHNIHETISSTFVSWIHEFD
jgi:hypothetical protein